MCVFSLVLIIKRISRAPIYHTRWQHRACVSGYIFVCMFMFLYVYVFTKECIFVSLSAYTGREWGSIMCLCEAGPGCSPDLSWELQWSMSSAENSKSKPCTYKLNGHALKTSTATLASSSMSSRAMKQVIDTRIVLGCQPEQEVQGILRFIRVLTLFRWIVIYIRLAWFQCKVTILFTVFKLAPGPCSNKVQHAHTLPPAPSPSRRYMK